jgi:hypothetical protein
VLGQMGCACGARSGDVCDCAFSKTARAFLAPNFGQIFVSCEFLGFLKNGCYSSLRFSIFVFIFSIKNRMYVGMFLKIHFKNLRNPAFSKLSQPVEKMTKLSFCSDTKPRKHRYLTILCRKRN